LSEEIKRKECKVMLIGNKNDLTDRLRQVNTSEGNAFAQSNQMIFFETSAKNNVNVNEAFLTFIQEISTVNHNTTFCSNDVAQKIQLIEQEREIKRQKALNGCACVLI